MKTQSVFYINDKTVKFLQVALPPAKLVTLIDVINIEKQNDLQITETLAIFRSKQKLNFAESKVTVVIARSRAILRNMEFPSGRQEEIVSMMDLQIASQIPYAREEVDVDFQVLSKTPEGSSKVAVVIIPQDMGMRYWKIFSDAKIPVSAVTISSVGLWHLYQQLPETPEKLSAIFDLDLDHTEICVCNKTQWLTSREIPVGFAQIQKEGYGEFLDQWQMTQNTLRNEKMTQTISYAYLVSSASRANALGIEMAKLHNELTIKEVSLRQILNLPRGVQWPKFITEDGVSFASLAGIALGSQIAPINLIPSVVKFAQKQRIVRRQWAITGIWLAAALISLGLALGTGFFSKKIQLTGLEDRLRFSQHRAARVEDQLQKIRDIQSMINGRLIFSNLAAEIYRIIPPQIYLVSMTISDGNTMSLQGVASTPLIINQFQKDMVDAKNFSNVSLDYVNKRVTTQGEVDYFKITCTLNAVNSLK